MMQAILDFLAETRDRFKLPVGRVLEVGSRDVNGTPRTPLGPFAESWLGIDLESGPGVDRVLNAEHIARAFGRASFDSVVCCECLEHTVAPWYIVAQMRYVLRPGGLLWISTPTFGFPLHRYPIDCYRFGEDAYRLYFFAGFDLLALHQIDESQGGPAIVAVGRKPAPFVQRTSDQKER